jgi:hypothetical protein
MDSERSLVGGRVASAGGKQYRGRPSASDVVEVTGGLLPR